MEQNEKYLMGVDVGSYESKGVLTDIKGNVIAKAVRKHELEFIKPGYVEHNAEKIWWGEFADISRSLICEANITSDKIQSVAVSGVFSMIPVDENAKPLRKGGIMYGVDTRSTAEIEEIIQDLGHETILERTGNPLTVQSMGPKILWLKNNEPEVYKKAYTFFTASSFIVARLTGVFAIDHLEAGFYGPLYDFKTQNWADDLCKNIVEIERLPEIKWASEVAGKVTKEAAAETGLAEGTPVTVGTSDVATEALSIGVTHPGEMMLMYGSTAWMSLIVDEPLLDENLWASPFIFPGTFCLHGGMATSGSLTRWMRDQLGRDLVEKENRDGQEAYSVLTEMAEEIPAGSDGIVILPYFSGERSPINDPLAKGMIFGLQIHHSRAHLYRAALEAVGYSINHTLQVMQNAGAKPTAINSVGGGIKSPVWLQSVSDITGLVQNIPKVALGASYGNAFLAGYAVGLFKEPTDIKNWVHMEKSVKPNKDNEKIYNERMQTYLSLYKANKNLMHKSDEQGK